MLFRFGKIKEWIFSTNHTFMLSFSDRRSWQIIHTHTISKCVEYFLRRMMMMWNWNWKWGNNNCNIFFCQECFLIWFFWCFLVRGGCVPSGVQAISENLLVNWSTFPLGCWLRLSYKDTVSSFTSPSLTSSLQTSVTSSCGQLQILNLEPNSSPSSSVLGKCFHRVSGKNSAAIPPTAERVPMMTKGKTWL